MVMLSCIIGLAVAFWTVLTGGDRIREEAEDTGFLSAVPQ
jgi:hypothetical protein